MPLRKAIFLLSCIESGDEITRGGLSKGTAGLQFPQNILSVIYFCTKLIIIIDHDSSELKVRRNLAHCKSSECKAELSMDRNTNLFRQECIGFLGTGAGMKLLCGLPEQEQEFRLTV